MQVRRVRFSRIESHNDALAGSIDLHLLYAGNSQQRFPQLPDAFVAIFSLGRDLDRFQNRCTFAEYLSRLRTSNVQRGPVATVMQCLYKTRL